MHLYIVITLTTQYINNNTSWRTIPLTPVLNAEDHLVAILNLGIELAREEYIHLQLARVGMHEDSRTAHLRHAYILTLATLQHLGDSTLGVITLTIWLTLKHHLDPVTI